MTSPKSPKKRNRFRAILLLPIAILTFIIGWTLIWLGSKKTPQKQESPIPRIQKDNVILMVIPQEEEQEITVEHKNN